MAGIQGVSNEVSTFHTSDHMKQEINSKDTGRAQAFELWMKSPMPMVTLVKTFDVTHLYRISKRRGLKFNMLLCWCIGKAASQIDDFYLLPEQGKTTRILKNQQRH